MNDELSERLYSYPHPKEAMSQEVIPFSIIGVGSGRIITENPHDSNTVYKFAVGHGLKQNKTEISLSNGLRTNYPHEYQSIIAPVYKSGNDGKWLLMEKMDSTVEGTGKFIGPESDTLKTELQERGYHMYELESGILNGNPIVYDYGVLK